MSENSFAGINFSDPESETIFKNHDKMRCKTMPILENESDDYSTARHIQNQINNRNLNVELLKRRSDNAYMVSGMLMGVLAARSAVEQLYVKYWAASPPTYNSSFSGSGLPFPNPTVAFEGSDNEGVVPVYMDRFSFSLKYPNSYYDNMGSKYIGPCVHMVILNGGLSPISNVHTISLGEGIPFRTLTWSPKRDWNKGPLFYMNKTNTDRNQFQILMDSAYPTVNKVPDNFWGKAIPN